MKKNLFIVSLVTALSVFSLRNSAAQEIIPDDPLLIKGKLDNGMTYFIRHNSNPEGCADFYIIHNVGALQEEDNQNGLAHFLEHMAFNGTEHYPDKTVLEFLARDGVRFGYNVNAYTNKTETVYNISSVPLVRESFVDSVLMVIHDWSCAISCEPAALDAERGVISEEWRRRDEPRSRMAYRQNDLIYKGAKHTRRTVLGTLEVINGFKPEEILDFYHKWYRPDLQAIVVVGDFDAEEMERKVRRMFADIPASENPEPKGVYPVPELSEPLFENMLDPQVRYHVLKVIHRQPFPEPEIRNTDLFYRDMFSRQIVTTILADRMKRDAGKPGSPLSSAVLVTNPCSADFYISLFTLSLRSPDRMEEAVAFYVREVEKMLRFGFTESEFEDARFKVMKKYRLNIETFASDVTSRDIVNVCKEHFLRGFPAAFPYDIEQEKRMIIGELSYGDVKGYEQKMFGDSEKIYSWCMNEDEADRIPSPERMEEIIALTGQEEMHPDFLENETIDISYDPQPGSVVKVRKEKSSGNEVWTLSNGAKVYWTPSDSVRSNTHLAIDIFFDTGYNAFPQDKVTSAKFVSGYLFRHLGLGGHAVSELRNSPECAGVNISSYIGQRYSLISATADRRSPEKCFSMVYGLLSDPCFATEATLRKTVRDNLRSLGKKKGNDDLFKEEAGRLKYASHPWKAEFDSVSVEAVDMDFVKDVYTRSFGDFSGMSVYISSDLGRPEIEALVSKYVASLDGIYEVKMSRTPFPDPAYKGEVVFDRSYPVETVSKSDVAYWFKGKMKLTPENLAIVDILDYIMSARYLNQIREVRGGTYHVSFSTEIDYSGNGAFESVVSFQTRPGMTDILVQDVKDGMERMAQDGPTPKEMDDAVKYLVKRRVQADAVNANSLVQRNLERTNQVRYGLNPDYDYVSVIGGITSEDIRKFAARLAKGDKFVSIYREE